MADKKKKVVDFSEEEGTTITTASSRQEEALRQRAAEGLTNSGVEVTPENVDQAVKFMNDPVAQAQLSLELGVARQLQLLGAEATKEQVEAGVKFASDPVAVKLYQEQLGLERQFQLLGVEDYSQEMIDKGLQIMRDPVKMKEIQEQLGIERQRQLLGLPEGEGPKFGAILDDLFNTPGNTPPTSAFDHVINTTGNTQWNPFDRVLGLGSGPAKPGTGQQGTGQQGTGQQPGSGGANQGGGQPGTAGTSNDNTEQGPKRGPGDDRPSHGSSPGAPRSSAPTTSEATGRTWETTADDKNTGSGDTRTSTERTTTTTTEYKNSDGTFTYKTETTTTDKDGNKTTTTSEETTDEEKTGYYADDGGAGGAGSMGDPAPQQHGVRFDIASGGDSTSSKSIWNTSGNPRVNAENPDVVQVVHTVDPNDPILGVSAGPGPFDTVRPLVNPWDEVAYYDGDQGRSSVDVSNGRFVVPGAQVAHTINPDDVQPTVYEIDPTVDRHGPVSNPDPGASTGSKEALGWAPAHAPAAPAPGALAPAAPAPSAPEAVAQEVPVPVPVKGDAGEAVIGGQPAGVDIPDFAATGPGDFAAPAPELAVPEPGASEHDDEFGEGGDIPPIGG